MKKKIKHFYFILLFCHYIKRFEFYNKIDNFKTDLIELFISEFMFYIEKNR